MSGGVVDEIYAVHVNTRVRARIPHWCDACDETIEPGHLYHRIRIVHAGQPVGYKRCLRCETIHATLVKKLSPEGAWPHEDLNCGHTWGDANDHDLSFEMREEPPEEIAALAFLTPAEAQVQLVKVAHE